MAAKKQVKKLQKIKLSNIFFHINMLQLNFS